jgi:hypothetical protein
VCAFEIHTSPPQRKLCGDFGSFWKVFLGLCFICIADFGGSDFTVSMGQVEAGRELDNAPQER